ncbi:MAG: hypothetical protein KatS3mg015_0919 [Fimbriimonadales bacterium]|nr:MAG: hypothetical protein KatS3mg015_0919 [Fimbriimonadales bacterium]
MRLAIVIICFTLLLVSCGAKGPYGTYELETPGAIQDAAQGQSPATLELRKDGTFVLTAVGESLSGSFSESDGALQFTVKSDAGDRTFQGAYSEEDKAVRLLGMTFRKKE